MLITKCVFVSSGQMHELTVMDKEKEHMSRLKDVVDMKVQEATSTQEVPLSQKVASSQKESPDQLVL